MCLKDRILSVLLVLAVTYVLWAREAQGSSQIGGSPDQDSSGEVDASTRLEFVLGVGDVLAISVWKEAELRASVPVRPDGRINVPLLGEIVAANRTPLEVQQELTKGYEQFVAAPAVSLVVSEINSRKVYVLGEVNTAGVYNIIQPTNLLQALAMAGGCTDFAKKDEIVVIRAGSEGGTRRVVSVKDITSGRNLEDNIQLVPGDTIYVP